jgi:hypothetical protein
MGGALSFAWFAQYFTVFPTKFPQSTVAVKDIPSTGTWPAPPLGT